MLEMNHSKCPANAKRRRWLALLALNLAIASPQIIAQPAPGGVVRTLGGVGAPGYVEGVKGFSQFNTPSGLAVRADGRLFIADYGNNAIRTMLPNDTRTSTFATGNRPIALAFDSGTNLFVANQGNGTEAGTITKFSPSGRILRTDRPILPGGLITALAIDRNDNVYVAQLNGVVTRLDPNGVPNGEFRAPLGRQFRGVAVADDGSVFVTDSALHVIWRYTAGGGPAEVFAGTQGSPGSSEGEKGFGKLNQPHQIAMGPNSTLVVADRGNHKIRAVSCEGVLSTLYGIDPSRWFVYPDPSVLPGWWDSSAEFAELRDPVGVAVDTGGNVYDSEVFYHLVRWGRELAFPTNCVVNTNLPLTAVLSPAGGFFQNGVTISITSSNNVPLGPNARIYYTLNGNDPTNTDQPVPIIDGVGRLTLAGPIDLSNLRVRIFNAGVPGPVAVGQPAISTPVAVLVSPNSGFYPTGIVVRVTSDAPGGFGPGVQLFYTLDDTDPDRNDNNVPIIDGIGTIVFSSAVDLGKLRVRAFNNGVPGPVATGQPTPLPLPGLSPVSGYFITNTVVTITNKTDPSGLFPPGTSLFYTLDGSEPSQNSPEIPIVSGRGRLELTGPVNLVNLKVRAFLGNTPGVTVSGEPTSFVPNRISFGFEPPQEASSDFFASPGQRFYAPVTLTIRPGQLMYGLQFALTITNLTGPAPLGTYQLDFESMLVKPVPPNNFYVPIPPATLAVRTEEITNIVVGTNILTLTNVSLTFSNLVFHNPSQNLLGVGWLERLTHTNLYNTREQDLIRYSLPHDTLFVSQNGKVVPGAFSFVVPREARPGDTYRINIIRPSANEDGIRTDVFIETPDGSDPNVPIRAVQTVRVAERRYIVGDLAPFRWFNAGDFGDGSILNNDLEQVHQTAIYFNNAPPPGSDFEDAMDSCCVDTNRVNRSNSFAHADGSDTTINQIGFGDGALNIADLYVTFRRALDPSLVWYARYWSNGVRQAEVVPNTFRGQVTPLSVASSASPVPPPPDELERQSVSDEPSVTFRAQTPTVLRGQVAAVPIVAEIKGAYRLRTLLLNLKIKTLDGPTGLAQNVSFVSHPLLGAPNFGGSGSTENYGAAWVDPNNSGLAGTVVVGTLYVPIPATATATSAYLIHFDKASASPNGIGILPATTQDGVIIMADRPSIGWNDGIPDQWRIQYFGTLINLDSAANADADGDSVSNRAEFDLGTNPVDPSDNLRIHALGVADRQVKLQFRSAPGKKYRIEASSTLQPGSWTTIQSEILGTGSDVQLSSDANTAYGYYRIRLQE
jgi:hypothetical protein